MTSYMWNIEHVMYYPQNKQTGSIILQQQNNCMWSFNTDLHDFLDLFFGGFFFKLHIENAINHVKWIKDFSHNLVSTVIWSKLFFFHFTKQLNFY